MGYPPPGIPICACARHATESAAKMNFTVDGEMRGPITRLLPLNHFLVFGTRRVVTPVAVRYIGMVSLRHLLVVGEVPHVRESLAQLLSRPDHSLQSVSKSADALECLRAEPYDLVLAGDGANGNDPIKLLRR